MPDLTVRLGGLHFKNPIIGASGTFGFGQELEGYLNLDLLGGLVTKGLSLEPRPGGPAPRICEVVGGMLNAIGLANPGLKIFLKEKLPFLQKLAQKGCVIIVNLYGESEQEFIALAEQLSDQSGISVLEINLSCPNVSDGGMAFGVSPKAVEHMTGAVRRATKLPIWVKLTPNVTDITEIAKAAAFAGADGVSLINTLLGIAIDPQTRKPRLGNITGGLSGPGIKPIALRMVFQVARAVNIPVIGLGGITQGQDVAEFMIAGSHLVQVGTANLIDPSACNRILKEFIDFCKTNKIDMVSDLTNSLEIK